MLKVILHGQKLYNYLETLRSLLAIPCYLERYKCDYIDKEFLESLEEADVLVSMEFPSYIASPKKLKLLQIPGAGTDKVDFSNIPLSVPVCNAPHHIEAVAEYIVMGILAWSYNLKNTDSTFRNGSWKMSYGQEEPLNKQLKNKIVGIVGYGSIGHNVSKKLKAFGTKIFCCNRSKINESNLIDRWYNISELNIMLKEVDFIIISLALSSETENIINASSFDYMKSSAVIINVARGKCIEEEALFKACKNKKIAGAIIDVWYNYPTITNANPLPSKYPFHLLNNVIMTPHSSAWTAETLSEILRTVAENITRLSTNRKLLHILERDIKI